VDNSNNEDGFKIQRSTGSNANYVDLVNSAPSNTVSYDDGALAPNTIYYYKIRSFNTGGNSNWSAEASATTPLPVPGTPTIAPATNITSSSFQANWNIVDTMATYYLLDVATDNGFTAMLGSYNGKNVGKVIFAVVSGLNSNTTYYYRVRAANISGISNYSSITNLTTSTGPTAPTASSATNISPTSFTAQWNFATGATNYRLDVATNNTFSAMVSTFNNLSVGNVTNYKVTGLTASTTYYYRVRAEGISGTSANSNIISVVTYSIPQITLNSTPGEVTVTNGSIPSSVTIWASVSDINTVTSMYLQYRKVGVTSGDGSATFNTPYTINTSAQIQAMPLSITARLLVWIIGYRQRIFME
jgi:hypothetical protein